MGGAQTLDNHNVIRRLYRHPHLFGMALMAPAVLVIFGLHSFTTGRIYFYIVAYLYPQQTEAIEPICKSIEFDLIYIVAFISFSLALPSALACRIGLSVLQELHQLGGTSSFSRRFAIHFGRSIQFIFVFIALHAFVMPLLLRIPLGQPLWVEHNFDRNVVFLSFLVVLIAVPLQLVLALAFSEGAAASTYPISPILQPRRSFPLLIGTPLAGIAFWLLSSIAVLSLFEAAAFIFGPVSTPGLGSIAILSAVTVLGFTLAVLVARLLGIWRCSVRALIVITLMTIVSQFSSSLAFPIDWFKVCTIWTD
jgi:hypothetical protein